jgi:hypothetical protein
MISTVLIEIAGVGVVLLTLRDVFHDIFHPTRSGSLSDFIGAVTSKGLRHTRFRPAVGPFALVTVIFSWVVFLTIGFALIYLPLLPGPIETSSATSSLADRILRSLSMSLGSLDTFQTFDMHFGPSWLKLVVAVEGLVGICLITASVSWLVLIYPALERTRFLARRTFVLVRAREISGLKRIENDSLLIDMADRVIQARIDLILFPILLNFFPSDASQTLAAAMPHLRRIANDGSDIGCSPQLRFAALQLNEALGDFSQMLSEHVLFTRTESVEDSFQHFVKYSD